MKPRLLDLFCGAGGASAGYAQAGFEVHGVDFKRQPRYPYAFTRSDAIAFLDAMKHSLHRYQAIHASPPCQRYTHATRRWSDGTHHPDLVGPIRDLLVESGLPYVIENVMAAPLINPIMLCGTMFDLGVFRHRIFETNWGLEQPDHPIHDGRVGDGRYFTVAGHCGYNSTRDGRIGGNLQDWRNAMGIDWMTSRELAQAIPPMYTRFIGVCLRRYVGAVAA